MSDNAPCVVLDWDTKFFNIPIARVCQDTLTHADVQIIDNWCSKKSIDCLYFLARSDKPATLKTAAQHGFHLMDIRITYAQNLSTSLAASYVSPLPVRLVKPDDIPLLQQIARHSYMDTRFYVDENFPRNLCHALYETWISQSCQGYADAVFAAELNQTITGYISCLLNRETGEGNIGLVGVDAQARGQGVGQALVQYACHWLAAQQMSIATVVTQGRNIAAQRLYQKNGFLTKSVQLWYHKWYNRETSL